ncbi:MAG: gluconokinase [Chloroflexi bacterium]|nr:gluconokinase [Chloroflexota bacterium]
MTATNKHTRVSPFVGRESAEPPLILALDIGTSSIRALLFDRQGRRVLDIEGRAHPLIRHSPPGASEVDPDSLIDDIFSCIDVALAQAGDLAYGIAAVATDTFVNNILGIDVRGQAVTALTTYADTRSAAEVEGLRRDFDEVETHNRTGCRFHPSYLPARLRWLYRVVPEQCAQVDRWVSIGEYVEFKLFGEATVTYSTAAWTGLLDWRKLVWDEHMLAGLPIAREQLSPLSDASQPRRGLLPDFAKRWPSLKDVPWFSALGDGATANVGSGCTSAARVALTVGTTSAMRAVVETDIPRLPSGLWCYRVDARRALPGGALTEGGMVYAWMNDTLRLGDSSKVEQELGSMAADAHGLTLLPLFAGERSPGWAGHARATLHGLTLATTPVELLRAGLESVAYRIALVYEQIRLLLANEPEIIASGGALLRSPVWLQIMADVLGRPIAVSQVQEATARGAVLLALEALGELDDIAAAPDLIGETYQPAAEAHEIYQQAIARQKALYAKLVSS